MSETYFYSEFHLASFDLFDHLANCSEIFLCSSEVFASSSFKGFDSQFSTEFDYLDVSVSDWDVFSWGCIELFLFIFRIFLYYETKILHLSGMCLYYLGTSLTWWAKSLLTGSSCLFLSYYFRVAWKLLFQVRDKLD